MSKQVRLDKFLADAGAGTRSQVKSFLKKGLVTVNGEPARKPEQKISPETDLIVFQGTVLSYTEFYYYMLNKPSGYVSATDDNTAPTVLSLLKGAPGKDLFPVGRLDKDTEGLLLITNDGALAHRLLSPSSPCGQNLLCPCRRCCDGRRLFQTGSRRRHRRGPAHAPGKGSAFVLPVRSAKWSLPSTRENSTRSSACSRLSVNRSFI